MLFDDDAQRVELELQCNKTRKGFLCYHKYMLPRSYRISADKFPAVTRGKSFLGDHVRVVVKYDDALKNPKCAVIVSNKVAKTAVARNRVRRQVYAALGELVKNIPNAYISVFPARVPLEHEQIMNDLKKVFKK